MARIRNGLGHATKPKNFQKDSFSIGFDSDISAALQRYAAYIKEEALRPAAAAAARVFYGEMLIRVPVFAGKVYTNKTGKRAGRANATPGQLRASIYHWHDTKKSVLGMQVYAIGPNKRKAPHWNQIEYGNAKMAAKPFVRPTWDAKKGEAIAAALAELKSQLAAYNGEL